MITFTSVERQVFDEVARWSAVTSRRIEAMFGNRQAWQGLIHIFIDEWPTSLYGTVLYLTPEGQRRALSEVGSRQGVTPRTHLQPVHYASDEAVVNRAYLVDAIDQVTKAGYTVEGFNFRTDNKRKTVSNHILSVRLRVPDSEMLRLDGVWDDEPDARERYGYPLMYATISGGGISPQRAEQLHDHHRYDIAFWKTPLILVVPKAEDIQKFANKLSKLQADHAELEDAQRYERIKVIEQPILYFS